VAVINSTEPKSQANPETGIKFRWTHIALPLAFLIISLILAAVFYGQLPDELSYRFQADSPAQEMGRTIVLTWTIVPQIVFALIAFAIVRLTLLTTRYLQPEGTLLPRLLLVMGNMLALPQIILAYLMLDIFLYNACQVQLITIWIFALIILVLGAVILGAFFIQGIREARRLKSKNLQE
jgi:uncharacterized membrane protein